MKKRFLLFGIVCVFAVALTADGINFKIGLFQPRVDSDIWQINMENLILKKGDFRNIDYSIEYENFINRFCSISLSLGAYRRQVDTEYRDYEKTNGAPILQSVYFKINPLELNIRLYPLGDRGAFLPFIGAGGGLYFWRYEQFGEFINFNTMETFESIGISKATDFGFNIQAGLIFKLLRSMGVSLQGRMQFAKGDLSPDFEGFEPLDLSGYSVYLGFHFFI